MTPPLGLRAFGEPALVAADGAHLDALSRKTKRFALLIYLMCDRSGDVHRRDELVAIFWPEAGTRQGRNALRQALFVIRNELDLDAIPTNGSHEIRVDRTLIDSDVGGFERALANERPEKALVLYRADFLQGFHVTGCPAFDVWMEERRAELSWKAFSASQNLAHQAEERRDRPSALHWWRRSLSLRPYDESVMRRIMLLLSGGDNRGRALAEFERFRRRMSMDLGLDPSEETLAFARSLATTRPTPAPQWVGDRRRSDRLSAVGDGGERVHWRRMSDSLPH